MESLRGDADLIIDTTSLTPHELRDRIRDAFSDAPPEHGLQVSITSFGFKFGTPRDADLVLDVRFLPNPHWIDDLRLLLGTDERVREYVAGQHQYRGVHGAARSAARGGRAGLRGRGQVLPHGRGGLHGWTASFRVVAVEEPGRSSRSVACR